MSTVASGTEGHGADALDALLLDAKIAVPEFRDGLVSRSDLVERARGSRNRFVGVTAPAGYGKSTLLTEWALSEDRKVAWVSLDRFDDDPNALLTLLAASFGKVFPERDDLVAEVTGIGVSPLGRAAPRLATAFRTSTSPFVLVIDDFHELRQPACHFCPECGSTVYWDILVAPDVLGVAVGSFIDATFPPPMISGFEAYGAAWAMNASALPMPHHDYDGTSHGGPRA